MKKRNPDTYLSIPTKEASQRTRRKSSSPKQDRAMSPHSDEAVSLELSAEVQHGLEVLKQTPEVREARIKEIKAQIEAGTYQVDSRAIAHKMLGTQPEEAGEAKGNEK